MEVTEKELFNGDEGVSVRLEEGDDMDLDVSYSLDEERREPPFMNNRISIELRRSEQTGGYIAESETRELRVGSYNPLRAIAEIIAHVRDTYNYTSYAYETYSKDDEVEQVRIIQNDEILFRVGRLEDDEDEYEIEEHSFSYDFWQGLHMTEHTSSRKLEKIDHGVIGMESIRVPVKDQMDSIEKDLIVQLNKYLIEFYKDNNVLGEDIPLHKLVSFASIYSGHPVGVSTLTLHFEEED